MDFVLLIFEIFLKMFSKFRTVFPLWFFFTAPVNLMHQIYRAGHMARWTCDEGVRSALDFLCYANSRRPLIKSYGAPCLRCGIEQLRTLLWITKEHKDFSQNHHFYFSNHRFQKFFKYMGWHFNLVARIRSLRTEKVDTCIFWNSVEGFDVHGIYIKNERISIKF